MKQKCPFPGCTVQIPTHLFGCRAHWYSLSAAAKKEIYAAYNDYLMCRITLDELRRRQQVVLGEWEKIQ